MTALERYESRIRKSPDGCWEWQGALVRGYGQILWNGKREYAHRVAYMLANGPVPAGALVCHHCDNPPCVRPDHLYAGTAQTNSDDSHRRGRAWAVRGRKRPDMVLRGAARVRAQGFELAITNTDDERWWRIDDHQAAREFLADFAGRLIRGDSLAEVIA